MTRFLQTLFGLVLFYSLSGLESGASNVDKGLGTLKINARMSAMKPVLVEASADDLWSGKGHPVEGTFSSAWIYDHRKAGTFKYYGLKIARIEVYFQLHSDDTEMVSEFYVFCEKPSDDEARELFIQNITAANDEPGTLIDEETGNLIQMDWFGELSKLRVALDKNAPNGETGDYYIASYSRLR